MDLTPKQQASEAIRQAESILIVTGQRPNVDQVSSVVALSLILRKFGKKVTAVVSDSMPTSVSFMTGGLVERNLTGLRDFIMRLDLSRAEVDKLKYTVENGKLNVHITPFKGGFSAQDVSFTHGDYHYDLVIVMGVASRSKLDRVFEQNSGILQSTPILNLDFHRINESYGAINLVDTNAATLSEMLISLAESLQAGLLDEQIATAMLTGIIAATDRFSAPHTTAKSMTVAAQLMAAGAKQQQIIKSLYSGGGRDGRDGKDGRDGRDKDRRPEKSTNAAPQSAELSASKPIPDTESTTYVEPKIQSTEPVPVTEAAVNVEPVQAVEPGMLKQQETATGDDTGPNLAALDWNAVMPHMPTLNPTEVTNLDVTDVNSSHQMQPGVTSEVPNPGESTS